MYVFGLMCTIYLLLTWNIEYILFTGHSSTPLLVLTDVLYSLPLLYLVLFIVYWVLDGKTNCIQKSKGYKLIRCFFQDHILIFLFHIDSRIQKSICVSQQLMIIDWSNYL